MKINKKRESKRKGFTLIELVAVIALMAILALILVPNITAYTNKADDSKILANMKTVHTASELVNQTEQKLDKDKIAKLSNNANVSLDIVKDLDRVYDVYYVEKQSDNIIVKHLDKNNKLHIYPEELANYTISFNTDGGNSIPSITQIYGSKITKPKDPIKLGHVFEGWEPSIPANIPLYNLEVKANWDLQKLTVQFNPDGGIVSPESVTANYGSAITLPTPTRLFYLFQGWYTEKDGQGNKVASIGSLESNQTLYAKWKLDNIITRVKPTGTTSNTQTHKIPLEGVKTVNSIKVVSPNGGTAIVESIGNNEITIKVEGADNTNRTVQTGGVYTPAIDKQVTDTRTSYGSNSNPSSVSYSSDGYIGTLSRDRTSTSSYQTGGSYTPSESKSETDSRTSYGSNSNPSSISYNSGGYVGTLTKGTTSTGSYQTGGSYTSSDTKYVDGQSSSYYNSGGYSGSLSSYLYSGSYSPGGSRQETTTDYTHRISQATWNGSSWGDFVTTWDPSKPSDPSTTKYYNSGGYSGYLYERSSERYEYSRQEYSYPSNPYKGQVHIFKRVYTRWYYYGTVTKPASDTRVYKYSGYVTRPESDTRTYGTYYTASYSGTVVKPAVDTRTYDTSYTGHYSGTVTKPSSDTRTYDKFYDYELEIDYSKN